MSNNRPTLHVKLVATTIVLGTDADGNPTQTGGDATITQEMIPAQPEASADPGVLVRDLDGELVEVPELLNAIGRLSTALYAHEDESTPETVERLRQAAANVVGMTVDATGGVL
ncbi:MAG: hypothetical protein H5U40_07290 [Polyangiaceae bacterium]|nr:hypothetical protein [Polyangiaceae bacterium]